MTMFERIQELAKKKDKNLKTASEEMGYSKNYLYSLKTQSPKAENLKVIAEYFGVTSDYLLGREEKPQYTSDDLEEMIDNAMSFNGKPLSDHDREVARAYLEGKFGTK
ncbi:helix-turn-helix domain-containing protein [Vagococcus sp. JNUCC 83]